MQNIITRLVVIAVTAGVVAIGSTIAFFADTETSQGNTLTAGAIDLKVDNTSFYNGQETASWGLRDLTTQKFFNLNDVKPGDVSQHFISLHVLNNPAWACVLVKNKINNDNGLTDPEQEDGDTTGGNGEGELSQGIDVVAWKDIDIDNQHDPNEPIIKHSFFDVFFPFSIADSTTGNPLQPIQTEIIALSLCSGTQTVNPVTGTISCDGSTMNNTAQTDSLAADLSLYVEQQRNNPDFRCDQMTQ